VYSAVLDSKVAVVMTKTLSCCHCFGGGGGVSGVAMPRGSFLVDMQLFMNFVRAAPLSFWSSAPNLQVAILSLAVTASVGALGNAAANSVPVANTMSACRCIPTSVYGTSGILALIQAAAE
jgi:hypothetical protein